MKLRYTLGLYLLMATVIPWPEHFAAGIGQPRFHALIYLFGHSGVIHYVVNGIGWLMLWKVVNLKRTLSAWLLSVLCALYLPTSEPVIGWSTVIYYYLGICLASMSKENRIKILLLTSIGFFLPHVAAGFHAVMLTGGWITRKIEKAWEKTY